MSPRGNFLFSRQKYLTENSLHAKNHVPECDDTQKIDDEDGIRPQSLTSSVLFGSLGGYSELDEPAVEPRSQTEDVFSDHTFAPTFSGAGDGVEFAPSSSLPRPSNSRQMRHSFKTLLGQHKPRPSNLDSESNERARSPGSSARRKLINPFRTTIAPYFADSVPAYLVNDVRTSSPNTNLSSLAENKENNWSRTVVEDSQSKRTKMHKQKAVVDISLLTEVIQNRFLAKRCVRCGATRNAAEMTDGEINAAATTLQRACRRTILLHLRLRKISRMQCGARQIQQFWRARKLVRCLKDETAKKKLLSLQRRRVDEDRRLTDDWRIVDERKPAEAPRMTEVRRLVNIKKSSTSFPQATTSCDSGKKLMEERQQQPIERLHGLQYNKHPDASRHPRRSNRHQEGSDAEDYSYDVNFGETRHTNFDDRYFGKDNTFDPTNRRTKAIYDQREHKQLPRDDSDIHNHDGNVSSKRRYETENNLRRRQDATRPNLEDKPSIDSCRVRCNQELDYHSERPLDSDRKPVLRLDGVQVRNVALPIEKIRKDSRRFGEQLSYPDTRNNLTENDHEIERTRARQVLKPRQRIDEKYFCEDGGSTKNRWDLSLAPDESVETGRQRNSSRQDPNDSARDYMDGPNLRFAGSRQGSLIPEKNLEYAKMGIESPYSRSQHSIDTGKLHTKSKHQRRPSISGSSNALWTQTDESFNRQVYERNNGGYYKPHDDDSLTDASSHHTEAKRSYRLSPRLQSHRSSTNFSKTHGEVFGRFDGEERFSVSTQFTHAKLSSGPKNTYQGHMTSESPMTVKEWRKRLESGNAVDDVVVPALRKKLEIFRRPDVINSSDDFHHKRIDKRNSDASLATHSSEKSSLTEEQSFRHPPQPFLKRRSARVEGRKIDFSHIQSKVREFRETGTIPGRCTSRAESDQREKGTSRDLGRTSTSFSRTSYVTPAGSHRDHRERHSRRLS